MDKSFNKIFLVGFMASGKTTIGEALAKHLGMAFMDTDKMIEEQEKMTVQQIFDTKGESYFRTLEDQCFETLKSTPKDLVVATGGGMPCFNKLVEKMSMNFTTIYLKVSFGVLWERLLSTDYATRPLLNPTMDSTAKETLHTLFLERRKCYKRANISVNANRPLKPILDSIILDMWKLSR